MNNRGGALLGVIVLLALIAIAGWFAGAHTVIRTDKEIFWTQKDYFGFDKVYADTRTWNVVDYMENPDVTGALVSRGYKDLKMNMSGDEDSGTNMGDQLRGIYHDTAQKAGDFVDGLKDKSKD